jgi:hypothetical protein
MAEPKKGSAMLPLIIVGATLFGFGTWQSLRPQEARPPEINKTFEVTLPETPANPRTMQAPDAPAPTKDTAQRAAEDGEVTNGLNIDVKIETTATKPSIIDEDWFKAMRDGYVLDFRAKALAALIVQQKKGTLNCSPTLLGKTDIQLAQTDTVTCLATDGSKIEGSFEKGYKVRDVGPLQSDGEIIATSPDNKVITIRKEGDEFGVTEEAN